ncbi:MAG: bifunctional 3,4-dihydroxy-2-butanone-4-phosphate synthase/GTP cyclohydrolase II [Bacteriovoracaceae bacterium]
MKTNKRPLDTIEAALQDLKLGKMIIVVDDEDRENEGDFIMPAETITPAAVNFMASEGRGLICTPLTRELAEKYDLPPQVRKNTASLETAFTITIDAAEGISTGISASDRAHTIKLLSQTKITTPAHFARPGHIFPLIAKDGGVLERIGHTEAAVDLARMAGFSPVGVLCEITNPDGTMARFDDLSIFADKHDLKMISIEDLVKYRKTHDNLISAVEKIPFPNKFGNFDLYIFKSENLNQEHIAIVKGDLKKISEEALVRVHSECFTGDIFGSTRCDCGEQLSTSMQKIEENGSGMVIYLRQEGRGIGLFNKIKAYQLQDQGMDTAEANLHLGLPVDSRDYTMAHQILKHFNVQKVKLMTNNPLKIGGLEKFGYKEITRIPLEIKANQNNAQYLFTKKVKMGHLLSNLIDQ